MAEHKPVAHALLEDTAVTRWEDARKRLENHEPDRTYWLATARPDGRPHLVPILGLFTDGAFYFLSGEKTRKGINLAGDPRCSVSVSSTVLPSLDIIVEGDARKVRNAAVLRRVADAYQAKLEWPLELRDEGIFCPNAPTAGPPPFALYELMPKTVFGLPGVAGMEEKVGPEDAFGPTRWRF